MNIETQRAYLIHIFQKTTNILSKNIRLAFVILKAEYEAKPSKK